MVTQISDELRNMQCSVNFEQNWKEMYIYLDHFHSNTHSAKSFYFAYLEEPLS